jgi:hypothetical protein
MRRTHAGLILLVVQMVFVLSIAGKYLYERKTLPRIWVRAGQFDPNLPLRGRYLALQPEIDACGLPRDPARLSEPFHDYNRRDSLAYREFSTTLEARNGKLVAIDAGKRKNPGEVQRLIVRENRPCDRAFLSEAIDFFIPDSARTPFPLKPRQELWVEVTVPQVGPPRPIQLALSDASGFHPLQLH